MSLLPRRPQERLRTRPSLACLVRVEQVGVWIHKPDQVGGIQIPLHPDATPLTVVDAERERLLGDAATLTGLGAFRRACGDAVYLPASTFSQTGQDLHKQPWRTTLDAPTKATLPRPVGDLLQQKRTPLTNDLMRQAACRLLRWAATLRCRFASRACVQRCRCDARQCRRPFLPFLTVPLGR